MYNTIDAFIVGHYIGVTAFAAAGVVGFVQEYLKIIYLGLPAAFLYNWCAAVLRGAGDTKASLWILMIAVPKQVLNLQSPANRGIRADFIPMESRFFL
jgi:Na+-driven multidrug efflux pump